MKKLILISMLVLLSALMLAGNVFAATSGPHGNYVTDTSACGQCHNTHAAVGENLYGYSLAGTDNAVYEACVYCHKPSGSSKYDVVNGAIFNTVDSKYYAAAGGGVDNVLTTEGVAAVTGNTTATTSTHEVKAKTSSLVAPGGSTASIISNMSCSNCHSPHGTANSRQLLPGVNGVTGLVPALAVTNELGDEAVSYTSGFNAFCSSCHSDFNATAASSGDNNSGNYSMKKRHRVGMGLSYTYLGTPTTLTTTLPLEGSNVSCMTCHVAHGTAKTNNVTFNRADTYNGSATSTSSTLLRMNNRGVCQDCHKK